MRGGFLPCFGSSVCERRWIDVGLLIAIEAAGNASPEDPPLDFALHLVGERQPEA